MASLKSRLQADLTAAMKNREQVRLAALRMVLTGVTTEEVSGDAARELTDDEVLRVVTREVKKRKEAAEAFAAAGRPERAQAELDEAEVLSEYLPKQLDDAELDELVTQAIAEVTDQLGAPPGQRQMGQVMKAVNGCLSPTNQDKWAVSEACCGSREAALLWSVKLHKPTVTVAGSGW